MLLMNVQISGCFPALNVKFILSHSLGDLTSVECLGCYFTKGSVQSIQIACHRGEGNGSSL